MADSPREPIEFDAVDQYAMQADRFVDAIRGGGDVAVSIDDAIANMAVIDALFRSAADTNVGIAGRETLTSGALARRFTDR